MANYMRYFMKGKEMGGTFRYLNGDIYQGDWSSGKKNNFGSYFYANGDTYRGNWVEDKKNGMGNFLFKW